MTEGLGFAFSSIGQSYQVTFDDKQEVLITYSNPGPHSSSKPMKAVKSIKTRCVCEIEMPPKMATFKDDRGQKSKYIQTSRNKDKFSKIGQSPRAQGKSVGTHGKVSSLGILTV